MSKKHFIALADVMRAELDSITNATWSDAPIDSYRCAAMREKTWGTISRLADFCQSQNHNFNRERWLAYIAGECGPNGGEIKSPRKKEAA